MKILIVDDSKVMRSIVIRALRHAGFGGHVLVESPDGKSALNDINQSPPDLVLTDWNMPEMSGIDLLRNVRADGKKMPFVFVTSESTDEMRNIAIAAGARGLITKPFTPESFQAALSGVIR